MMKIEGRNITTKYYVTRVSIDRKKHTNLHKTTDYDNAKDYFVQCHKDHPKWHLQLQKCEYSSHASRLTTIAEYVLKGDLQT